MTARARLEMHEHSYIRGQRAKIAHAHERGDGPHEHPDTGPAAYTIDRDEWLAATGLVGGGRKKFSARATGPQLPFVEVEERIFRVVFVTGYTPEHERAGITRERYEAELACFRELVAGRGETSGSAEQRMIGTFRLTPIYEIETPETRP